MPLATPDNLAAWTRIYLQPAVHGVRSDEVAKKITLHLARFGQFIQGADGLAASRHQPSVTFSRSRPS